MSAYSKNEQRRDMTAVGVWDGDGGVTEHALLDQQFGRRIELDRSWTVYHVFTGIPAHQAGQSMTGLSGPAATDGMLALNRRGEQLRRNSGTGPASRDDRTRIKEIVA